MASTGAGRCHGHESVRAPHRLRRLARPRNIVHRRSCAIDRRARAPGHQPDARARRPRRGAGAGAAPLDDPPFSTSRTRSVRFTTPRTSGVSAAGVNEARGCAALRPSPAGRCCRSGRRTRGSRSRSRTRQSAGACLEQLVVHAEQRLAEADAARIVVVDEDRAGSAVALRCRSRCRCRAGRTSAAAARSAASQTPGPTTPSRRSSGAYGSAAITPRGIVSQYDGRVHLLLGQIELARPDVLVRVELDLLEADDARHDVDFAVRPAHRLGRYGGRHSSNVSRIVTRV